MIEFGVVRCTKTHGQGMQCNATLTGDLVSINDKETSDDGKE